MNYEQDKQYQAICIFQCFNAARIYGSHEKDDRLRCFARDTWKYTNAIKRGYDIVKKFLKSAFMHYNKEDIYKIRVNERLEKNQEQINPGPMNMIFVHHGKFIMVKFSMKKIQILNKN